MATKSKKPVGDPGVIILAAGMGKRMHSALPKVLHEVGGQPLIFHILDRVREACPRARIAVIVGHGREQVEGAIRGSTRYRNLNLTFVNQAEQRGTGHAVRCAMDSEWGRESREAGAPVLVLPGDQPLISKALVEQMLAPLKPSEGIRLLTCEMADPTGYGRAVRSGRTVKKIVEQKDATPREKAIREVAVSIYLFDIAFLAQALPRLSPKNAQGEYYLTDLVAAAGTQKKTVGVLTWPDADEVRGINDPWELAVMRRLLNERCLRAWALRGVRFFDPQSTWVDVTVELAADVTVHPGVILSGMSRIASGAILGPNVVLRDVEVGSDANIKTGTVGESSKVEAKANVGPYAHLRPDSLVGEGAKIGNFVELKKARIGEHSSVAHLSYVGDADVGKNVNIGCGFVTCNFDGRVVDGQRKHRTIIEDEVFLGSDCQTVAPVRIGRGAYVASGSTITEDVEPEALAIARSRQVTKPGYARKLKQKE